MSRALFILFGFHAALAAAPDAPAPAGTLPAKPFRVAVSQGLVNKGPWTVLQSAFTRETGITIETVSCRGGEVADALRTGTVDAGVMHATPATEDLINEGIIKEATPWASSGYVLVGPTADPAQVKGLRDGTAALGKIMRANQPMVRTAGQATGQLLDDFLDDPAYAAEASQWKFLPPGQDALATAAKASAYLLLPLQEAEAGHLKTLNLAVMVDQDPAMRRGFVVAVPLKSSHPREGRAFRDFLTGPGAARLLTSTSASNAYTMPLAPVSAAPGK